jgi:hypothetical protein
MDRLERELGNGLKRVAAPRELWDRVCVKPVPCRNTGNRGLVWALAAAVMVAVLALSFLRAERDRVMSDEAFAVEMLNGNLDRVGFHCQNPARLRAWVRARTGIDLPLRPECAPSIELIGAQTIGASRAVEVAYRAGNRDAVLLVSEADARAGNDPHVRTTGNVSTWVMNGQRYTLACNDPSDLQLACKLCHLD